jgi:TetR/AcrR family transcriptional regulator, fatty acid metabolism regulator protein
MVKARKKKEKGLSRKEAILEMATIFFAEKGFRDTAIGDIARMIGVADGTVFYHYRTKEDLFVAVLENFKQLLIRESREYLVEQQAANGLEMVEGLICFYIDLATRMEERFLLLHRHYPYKLAEENPACRRHLEDIYDFFAGILEQAIRRGQDDGSIRELPAQKTALIIFIMVDGLVRVGTYRLYQPGSLYEELLANCRRMLQAD